MVVDTHLHLTDKRLAAEASALVERARAEGVEWMVTVGTRISDSEAAVELAERLEGVYATVGIHPHSADTADDAAFLRLAALAGHPRVVAIGETGLDYHYDNSPRDFQRASFKRHLQLARESDLPVVVHARDADEDVGRIIRTAGWGRGVLHCFSGGRSLLEEALDLGWHISFSGMITFPKWESVDLLRAVPLDRLLVETDSPYLAPVPHRGKRNEPAFVPLVARRAAELRNEDPDELIRITSENARRFYRIDDPVNRMDSPFRLPG